MPKAKSTVTPVVFEVYCLERENAIKYTVNFLVPVTDRLLRDKAQQIAREGFFWEVSFGMAFISPRTILEVHWSDQETDEGRTNS